MVGPASKMEERALLELGSAYDNLKVQIPPNPERPSLVWRGDSIVLGSHVPRWAVRAFLEEEIGTPDAYVGFANLRPGDLQDLPCGYPVDQPATADAFLAPPLRQKRNVYTIWAESDFGILYGEQLPEHVTCFSMPYRRGGGVCAHACLYMCCTMLSRQGFRVPATHEVSYENARLTGKVQPDGVFEVSGLTAMEMAGVIRSPLIDGSALVEILRIEDQTEDDDRLRVIHFIQQYLSQGLPLILIIDCGKLYPGIRQTLQNRHHGQNAFPHAIVLIGTRFEKRGNTVTPFPEAFVYHDPMMGPYLERSVWELISAARFTKYPRIVAFVVPVPKGVAVRMSDVRSFLMLLTERGTSFSNFEPSLRPSRIPQRRTAVWSGREGEP